MFLLPAQGRAAGVAPRPRSARGGFSLVEVLVALLVLTVGLLALAHSTAYVAMQLRTANMTAKRASALQTATERLVALPYDSVRTRAPADGDTIDRFVVWWTVDTLNANLKQVVLYSEGPGYASGGWNPALRDTLVTRIVRPFP